MAIRPTIEFVRANYDDFTGGAIGTPVSEKQAAIITSCLFLCYEKDAWDDMSDADWDILEQELADIIELMTP